MASSSIGVEDCEFITLCDEHVRPNGGITGTTGRDMEWRMYTNSINDRQSGNGYGDGLWNSSDVSGDGHGDGRDCHMEKGDGRAWYGTNW